MFKHKRFYIEDDRVLEKGYTRDELRGRFLPLSTELIGSLIKHPSIVARELNVTNGDYWGALSKIVRISRRGGGYNIYFEPIGKVDMRAIQAEGYLFDIEYPFEYTRTYWAVKNINLMEALEDAGIEVMPYGEE